MKRFISLFILILFINALTFSAFSFKIDGKDSGVEWDGATVYNLIDGDSNCGVDLGVVKCMLDNKNSAVYMCFMFSDPNFTSDNLNAGISLTVEENSTFEVVAEDAVIYENINPYSFDGAVFVDENEGATCEVRVGFKAFIPEYIEFSVRFIDSQGFYSNHYRFTVVNEEYSSSEEYIMSPTNDNSDPAYNPDADKYEDDDIRTTRKKTTTQKTTKKFTTKVTSSTEELKTTLRHKSTRRTTTLKNEPLNNTTTDTTKAVKTQKETVKVYYYEKEIYISEVYVSATDEVSSVESVEKVISDTNCSSAVITTSENTVSLSDGTKYKNLVTVIGLTAFIALACFGVYSAKKNSED